MKRVLSSYQLLLSRKLQDIGAPKTEVGWDGRKEFRSLGF